MTHLLYRGCLLFGGSVIRGFTVYGSAQNTNSVSLSFYETNPWLCRCNLNQKNTPSCENEALAFATTLHSFLLFIVHATVANLLPRYRNPYSVILCCHYPLLLPTHALPPPHPPTHLSSILCRFSQCNQFNF